MLKMLIAHISDFHVFSDNPETSLVRADAAHAASKVIADIAAHRPVFDAVIFTGDLTDGGSAKDYALLKDILAPLSMPVFVVPGNHDKREGLRAAFSDYHPFNDGPTLNYRVELGHLRIIALDTLVEDQIFGMLDFDQIKWLDRCLQKQHEGPTVIAMHHPPFPSGIPTLDAMCLKEGREELGALVAAYPGQLLILAGHIHRPFQSIWNAKLCQVAGSPAFQHALDLRSETPEPGIVSEPYAYFILRFAAQQGLSIHKRYVLL